ncbi:MAG: cytidylate kinase-like family protein [Oscillospiraceae bacterium]|nr:cytidylate kinase-like family protein [Oscillospiraceae bacterium]
MNKIITIGREFGSGGRELGRRLARELGFDYYDKEILTEISKHTSLSEEYVQRVVESQPHQLFPITTGRSFLYVDTQPLQQAGAVFLAQQEIIREMADRSSCVIVGRCADHILRDRKPFRIFVYADMASRIARCRSRAPEGENLTDKEYKQQIQQVDKARARYYDFYTDMKWGDKLNYELCINTTNQDIPTLVPYLAKMFM